LAKEQIVQIGSQKVKLSNLEKILFTEPDISKAEWIHYLYQINSYFLKYNSNRPLSLIRYPDGIGKEKLTDIVFQKSIYLFDILMNRDFFKFDKEKKGPFSKLTGVLYNELKKYKNLSGLSLEEMSKYLEQKYTSETLEKEDRAIIKSIKLVNELYKLNSSDQEFEDQLELVTSILYLMNIENKSNEEEIVDGIVSWNKRKKEKYDSNKIVNTIKYMQNENIIQKGIFQNYTINRI